GFAVWGLGGVRRPAQYPQDQRGSVGHASGKEEDDFFPPGVMPGIHHQGDCIRAVLVGGVGGEGLLEGQVEETIPAVYLCLEQAVGGDDFGRDRCRVLRADVDRGEERADDADQLVSGKVPAARLVVVPGDLFEQVALAVGGEEAEALDVPVRVPVLQQHLDT